jgi:hypothetical protein
MLCGLRDVAGMPDRRSTVDRLVAELATGRIQSVAFVVPSDVRWTLPLYDVAITTARRGWKLGIAAATYWFVTPEPEPLAGFGPAMSIGACERLEPEGIAFIGSTYADVRQGVVLLDPQAELIHADRIVSLNEIGELFLDWRGASVSRARIGDVVAGRTRATRGSAADRVSGDRRAVRA